MFLRLCEKIQRLIFNIFYIFVGNMAHLSAVKKNLNCNIPRVKLQTINLCKYKTLNRQKPRIIKSEILKFKKIKVVDRISHVQEKSKIASKKNIFTSKKI